MTVYSDYSRDRIGWFFGLSGIQLAVVAVTALPMFVAVRSAHWAAAGVLFIGWLVTVVMALVPVRGRSVAGWLAATVGFALGGLLGWTRFRSRAASGRDAEPALVDLPGVLAGLQIHDGLPVGADQRRVALIQHHATRCWAVTAQVTHPGTGLADADDRRLMGRGLADLLNLVARTEKIVEVLLTVRTVPEDGAERELWVDRHRRPDAPAQAQRINADLATALARASVRPEQFVTLVVAEQRIAKDAKEAGGGMAGRARVLAQLMSEVEGQLVGGMRMTSVSWLTSPELAAVTRTGFAPGDRASIVAALAAHDQDPAVNADVPWSMAGPSGADPLVRHYSHDAWNSISATLRLPHSGAALGALAPVLTPAEPGERRSFCVCYPILGQQAATRQSANSEWAADMAGALRDRAGMTTRTRHRDAAAKARGMEAKLATGTALVRPYAVCTVTVPKTLRITEFGRRLDADVRRAGFTPLRLDLAQDTAFAATVLPLGVSLTRRGDA